jgi:hypothetical protein
VTRAFPAIIAISVASTMLSSPAGAQTRLNSAPSLSSPLPLSFEPNVGQSNPEVQFTARRGGQTLFLTRDQVVLGLANTPAAFERPKNAKMARSMKPATATIRMNLVNGQRAKSMEPQDLLPGKVNYFKGNDPSKWYSDIPTYGSVAYREVYPGIDLVFHGEAGALEYDFVAKPGSDPSRVNVQFQGASRIDVSPEGDLLLQTPAGQVKWNRPHVYQDVNGVRRSIAANYRLQKDFTVAFQLAKYDRKLPLVIDPTLVYSTLLGGNAYDAGGGVWVDSTGIYLDGTTYSTNFPTTTGEITELTGEYDLFLTKLNPQGSALIYSTYYGGSANQAPNSSWLAPDGSFYMTGFTSSYDFPIYPSSGSSTVIQTVYTGGNEDVFVVRFAPDGDQLYFSTYFGGSIDDDAYSMWVDLSGNIYLTGETESSYDFPTTQGAYQTAFGGGDNDAFVTKMSPAATSLIYSTYLGGNGDEEIENDVLSPNAPPDLVFVYGTQITVDPQGNAYISGYTDSGNFPTTSGVYSRTNHGNGDGFVTELNSAGNQLVYSTLLGGTAFDAIQSQQRLPDGTLLLSGVTDSSNFPTTSGAYRRTPDSGAEVGFVARFNPTLEQLTYSTFFGGTGGEGFVDAREGGNGSVVVSGLTFSSDVPTTSGALQKSYAGNGDMFMCFFDPTITQLTDCTYWGTPGYDSGSAYFGPGGPTDVLSDGLVGAAGLTTTSGAFSRSYAGGTADAFISRFDYTGGCQEPLNQTSINVSAYGNAESVNITASAGCPWFAYTNESWAALTATAYGTGSGTLNFSVGINTGAARTAIVTVAGTQVTVSQAAGTGVVPAFFSGSVPVGGTLDYLTFPDGQYFGYFGFLSPGWLYNLDMGYEYAIGGSSGTDVYLYDLTSTHWFYTNAGSFPYLYDFTLNNWLYYFPNTNSPGRYTSNPRYFSDLTTGKIITM